MAPVARIALALGGLALALAPTLERWRARAEARHRMDRLDQRATGGDELRSMMDANELALRARVGRLGPLLASWETIGGCGAGANAGAGGGIKWIGRNVSGGLVRIESQGNYIKMPYGYNYVVTTLVSKELTDRWTLGTSGTYLDKVEKNFAGSGRDVANKGPGDVDVLVTRKLGPINATSLTWLVGIPTGADNAEYMMQLLAQDRQLGFGKLTSSLILDHTIDRDWGPVVVGGTLNYRGGKKQLNAFVDNYRAPSASTYVYAGTFMGPFVPALGFSLTGAWDHDRNNGSDQATQLLTGAATASIEWSTDWMAALVGASFPYGYDGITVNGAGGAKSAWGWGPWVVAIGLSFAP